MNSIINKIYTFFSPQREIDKLSKDKYGKANLSDYNKNIRFIEEKDIPVGSQNIISGQVLWNQNAYASSGYLTKEECERITKEYNEKQEKI